MPNKTVSNVLAAGVAIAAFVLVLVGQLDIKVGGLFIAIGIAELAD